MLNEKELNVIKESYDKKSVDEFREEMKSKHKNSDREVYVPDFLVSNDLNHDVIVKRFKGKGCSGSLLVERYMKVFFILMDMANEFGVVNVTQQELADIFGASRATINVYMKYLKETNFIEETEKQGRYILKAEAIVLSVNKKYLAYLYDNMNKDEDDKDSISEFDYKFRYYKIVTNLGYDWKEFEEQFADELKEAYCNTPLGDIYNYNKLNPAGNVNREILKEKVKKVVEDAIDREKKVRIVYCTNCCSPIKENWNFCNSCGCKVDKVEQEISVEELDNMMEELENFNEKREIEEKSIENLSELFIELVNKSGLRYVEGLLKKQYGALHKFYMRNLMEMSGMKEKSSRVDSSREYTAINSGTMQILKKLQKVSELDGCFDEEIGVIVLDDGSQLGFIKGHIPKNMYLNDKRIYNLYLVDFYGRAEYFDFGLDEKPIDFYVKNGQIIVETDKETYYVREL